MLNRNKLAKRKEALRAAIGQINFAANREAEMGDLRSTVLGALKLGRNPKKLADRVMALAQTYVDDAEAVAKWLEPDQLARGGDFDACDLRIWLKIAEAAGVPFIEAKEILSLTDNQLDAVLPAIPLADALGEKLDTLLESAREHLPKAGQERSIAEEAGPDIFNKSPDADQVAAFKEAMETVLFDIPSSWMVRTHLAGSSLLKSLVGTGLMEKGDDVARIAQGVSLGAGWFQAGNHRLIDFADRRFVEMAAGGHKPVTHYLARPWHKPGRFHQGEDLHRANSPLAGPGKWPAEWRVFIRNGEVTGVTNYYGWTGEGATPQNCWNAIEAASLGQKIADRTTEMGLVARNMRTEVLRGRAADVPAVAEAFASIDPNGLHCSLDFLEGEDGLILLEGGPGHLPGGGAHPCAFAGQGRDPKDPARSVARCEGVAVLPMPHVHLAEVSTWVDGEAEGCILSWGEAHDLAIQFAPLSEAAEIFLAEGHSAVPEELLPTP